MSTRTCGNKAKPSLAEETHDSPVHDQDKQARTNEQEGNRHDCVCKDERQSGVQAIGGFFAVIGAFFQDWGGGKRLQQYGLGAQIV